MDRVDDNDQYVKASWVLHFFLVGVKKPRLGLGIEVGALQSVGADVIAKIEVFHCNSYQIINKVYNTYLVMCLYDLCMMTCLIDILSILM